VPFSLTKRIAGIAAFLLQLQKTALHHRSQRRSGTGQQGAEDLAQLDLRCEQFRQSHLQEKLRLGLQFRIQTMVDFLLGDQGSSISLSPLIGYDGS